MGEWNYTHIHTLLSNIDTTSLQMTFKNHTSWKLRVKEEMSRQNFSYLYSASLKNTNPNSNTNQDSNI